MNKPPRGTYTYASYWEKRQKRRLFWNAIFLLGLALLGAVILGLILIASTPTAVSPR